MSAPVSQKTIQNFSWRRITEEIEAKMPLLHACLAGAVTRWNNEQLFLEL